MKYFFAIAVVMLSILAMGCSSGIPVPTTTPRALPEYVSGLPHESRQASWQYELDGATVYAASAGTTVSGNELEITAPPDGVAWAVYELGLPSPLSVPVSLNLELSSGSGDYWVGLSDYRDSEAWEWHGPYGGSTAIAPWADGGKYVSGAGNTYWAVAAVAGTSITVSASRMNQVMVTYVNSPGIGEIALRIDEPEQERFSGVGAPVCFVANGWFIPQSGFDQTTFTDLGVITVSCLWPGLGDPGTGARSDGVDDYGGPDALAAMRDALRFACGETSDVNGNYLADLVSVTTLYDNAGLYAFSHPGVVATNVIAHHGTEFELAWFIGRENPTSDEQYPLEIGYWNDDGSLNTHPYYRYPEDYSPTQLDVDYSAAGWVVDPVEYPEGRPCLTRPDSTLHVFGYKGPKINGVRYFSRGLTQALEANNVFGADPWPEDVATYAEVAAFWPERVAVNNYPAIGTNHPDLKVMLVFAADDHVQAALDKPHVHQAWDGFSTGAGLTWVRLNPDKSYLELFSPTAALPYTEHDANTQPGDWLTIRQWGYDGTKANGTVAGKVAVAEMVDRAYSGNWDPDVPGVL